MFNNKDFQTQRELFNIYYKEKILPVLQPLEKKRKKMLNVFICILPLVTLWLIYALEQMASKNTQIGTFYGLSICLLILGVLLPMMNYYKKSKESLLPLVAGFMGDFTYEYQKKISQHWLDCSKIISAYDEFQTDDCFSGTYENLPISIIEYKLYQKRRVQTTKGVHIRKIKSKSGVLISAAMNKKFKGQTIITKDKGWLNRFTRYEKMQNVSLESVEFEKKYEVYSEDQIEARYLLTPIMLEYMLEVQKIFPKVSYSFFDDIIFINIETTKNLFECTNFFRSIINQKRIEQNFKELYYLFSIIKILRLNQKHIL